jgi:hypothetical protein
MYTATQTLDFDINASLFAIDHEAGLMYLVGNGTLYTVNLIDQSIIDKSDISFGVRHVAFDSVNKKLFFATRTLNTEDQIINKILVYDTSADNISETISLIVDFLPTKFVLGSDNLYVFYEDGFNTYNSLTLELVSSHKKTTDILFGKIYNSEDYVAPTTTTISPSDIRYLYSINSNDVDVGSISRFTNETNATVSPDITLGKAPQKIFLHKSSKIAYITNYYDNKIKTVDLSSFSSGIDIDTEEGVSGLAIDEIHNILYIINNITDEIIVYDIANNSVITKVKTLEFPTDIAIDTSARMLVVSHKSIASLLVVNTVDYSSETTLLSFIPNSIAIDSYRHDVYLADSLNNRVYRYNIVSKSIIRVSPSAIGCPQDLAFYPEKNLLVVTTVNTDSVFFIDTHFLTNVGRVSVENNPTSIAIDGNSGLVYISHRLLDKITVINSNNFTVKTSFSTNNAPTELLLFDPNTTTTSTIAPVTTNVMLTIPNGDTNYASENFVTFYGNDGDVLMYEKIEVSEPVTLYELLVYRPSDNALINRFSFPIQYFENNVQFILKTDNGSKRYQSSFSDGSWVTDTDGANRHRTVTVTDIGTTIPPP